MTTLAEKLASNGIMLPSYANGSYKIRCPKCSAQRKNKNDPCLSVTVNDDGAAWNCWNGCGFVGGVNDREPARIYTFKPKSEEIPSIGPLFHDAVEFFNQRGIGQHTLSLAGVGCCAAFIPAKQERVPCIAFPYRDVGGKIVNIKFRTLDKEFAQVKGAKKLFFGFDRVEEASNQLVICEGEIDALSLTEAGIVNAVSVPDGASDRKWEFLDDEKLARFNRVVIAGDDDQKGRELGKELARRFGFERCWQASWPDDCKDANDVLVKHGPEKLADCISVAKPYPVSGLHLFDEYRDEIWNLYSGHLTRGATTGWGSVDKHMTIRPGELTVVSGVPGAGKSEFVDALCINLAVMRDWNFAMCSFENPPSEHFAKLAEKFSGKPFFEGPRARMEWPEVEQALAWTIRKFVLVRADDEAPTIDWILDRARVAAIRHGIRGLVIDPYNEIEHKRSAGMNETEYVNEVLTKVKRFARNHECHVWFVAHPMKPLRTTDKKPEPSLYDISGSANWANKADIGLIVEREPDSTLVTLHVKKVRFRIIGSPGKIQLSYDRATGTYHELTGYSDES